MNGSQVLEVMALLEREGITGWIDGGWGVDALLGTQTRQHADLDLAVDAAELERLIARLVADGFAVLRDELPSAIALRHADGREIDLHPLALTEDGGGDQAQPNGSRWHYGPPATGHVDGRPVACNDLGTQLRSHVGYKPGATDVADMRALAARFGCRLPPPYD